MVLVLGFTGEDESRYDSSSSTDNLMSSLKLLALLTSLEVAISIDLDTDSMSRYSGSGKTALLRFFIFIGSIGLRASRLVTST